jgi:DNA helicase-2/ATP-dependent DNA helicase PcrA
MEQIILKKQELINNKNDYINNIYNIDNQLLELEKQLAVFSNDDLLNSFNLSKSQKLIVETNDDNMVVIASAGSGKTSTLVAKYTNLILKSTIIKPENILLITFTKKAGNEMLNRLENIIPDKLPFHTGTLHGLAYKILQKYNNINYTVIDEQETKELLKLECDIILNNIDNIDEDKLKLIKFEMYSIVSCAVCNYPINFNKIIKDKNLKDYDKIIVQIYKAFITRKKKENLVDFNDLMIDFCSFLKTNKSNEFKDNIKYIFFDEYQDINPVQNYILAIFKNKAQIMVVGDDAQSIYSFRGSDIKYILDFQTNFNGNLYLLEENYRSTPAIVDFYQNIIEKNLNQYKKNVISKKNEIGLKPIIYAFDTIYKNNKKFKDGNEEQYEFIVKDIINKINNGVKLSDIVILARSNHLLENIELELLANNISTVKLSGIALLDKTHIKDYIAFIYILINPKSSIHWKRIISLHNNYNINKANKIIEKSTNISNDINILANTDDDMKNLILLYDKIKKINKDYDKLKIILFYLEKLWINKKKNNIDECKKDIYIIINYIKNGSLIEFINDVYLNQNIQINNTDNSISLSTVHSSKGLEWEHVYIIDMNSDDFPNIRTKYFSDELADMEEERRLFYVACSRAKKYLTITYHTESKKNIFLSPFIRELNNELYLNNNVVINNIELNNKIPQDVTNILKFIGFKNISEILKNLKIKEKIIHNEFNIPTYINKSKNIKMIIGTFIDLLIPKMLQNNFLDKIKKFDLNVNHDNVPQKFYHDYIDDKIHWNNLLNIIFNISIKNNKLSPDEYDTLKNFLFSPISLLFYNNLENGIKKLIDELFKPKTIHTHYNVNFDNLKGEIDLLIDDVIIEIKTSSEEICTIKYLSQVLLYAYSMKKKSIHINKVVLYNVQFGILHIIDTSKFDFQLFYDKLYGF